MVKLNLVVTRYVDCNENIIQRFDIVTHNVPADKDIQLQLYHIRDIHLTSIHAQYQLTTHNSD